MDGVFDEKEREMPRLALSDKIDRLQSQWIIGIHDLFLSAEWMGAGAKKVRQELCDDDADWRQEFSVPGCSKNIKREKSRIGDILRFQQNHGIYQMSLVAAISQFEAFLSAVLKVVFERYPKKLCINHREIAGTKTIPLEVHIDTNDPALVTSWAIDEQVAQAFRASPECYLGYLEGVFGMKFDDGDKDRYLEFKATRDLIVHNQGVINRFYLQKANDEARGDFGEVTTVDADYFAKAIANLKAMSI
jgi:hypothetical protein